ncbi:hypothetical protein CEXT_140161 [Caerostris extrusa]|uniref:Uncharacterized protein n=1 Tax=Caerostris extrusa TaxID=172846 RepID=A0AAV4TV79_CAEEX|nr:hypothetical protein CEXT_140161 [Caerostris extrusa]
MSANNNLYLPNAGFNKGRLQANLLQHAEENQLSSHVRSEQPKNHFAILQPVTTLPPRPMFPENFPPAIWNPWFIWPAPRFCPPTTVNNEEVYKNCMRSRLSHQQQRSNLPGERKIPFLSKANHKILRTMMVSQPLIIDDSGANSDDDKENSQ